MSCFLGRQPFDIFGLGTDNQMCHKARDGSAWLPSTTGWEPLGGTFNFPQPSWTRLSQLPAGYASAMWLMQDGSVLANLYNSTQLVALHPDGKGSYANGSW